MPAVPRPTRRSALALAAVGLVALTGCDDGGGDTPGATPAPDPDVALVDRVLVRLRRAERLAVAAGDPGWARLHAAHIEALDGRPARSGPAPGPVSAAALRAREERLAEELADAAVAAASGALARLLASMSAAVSQRLAAEAT